MSTSILAVYVHDLPCFIIFHSDDVLVKCNVLHYSVGLANF